MIYYFLVPVLYCIFRIVVLAVGVAAGPVVSAITMMGFCCSLMMCLQAGTQRRQGTLQMSRSQFVILILIMIADTVLTVIKSCG